VEGIGSAKHPRPPCPFLRLICGEGAFGGMPPKRRRRRGGGDGGGSSGSGDGRRETMRDTLYQAVGRCTLPPLTHI
jgi:hypothetical protein